MAEELQDASYRLPRVMLWATIINGGMMFIMAVTVTYCIGDLDAGERRLPGRNGRSSLADASLVLSTPTGYPYIQIFYNVTGSLPATNAMTALILILGFFGNVTVMAGSSRQLFAFARDEGMPFSKWISKVGSCFIIAVAQGSSTDMKVNLTNIQTDPSCRRRPRQRHPSHLRPRRDHLTHQHRQHSSFQHRNIPRHRHSHDVIHRVHLLHRLAQVHRRASLAISLYDGPRLRAVRECDCAGVVVSGVCGGFLPCCACSVVDYGGYELVSRCVRGGSAAQCDLLCCLGKETVCWARGVRQKAGVGCAERDKCRSCFGTPICVAEVFVVQC